MVELDGKTFYEDNEVIEKTQMAPSNYKLFRRMLKKFNLIKNGQKLSDDHIEMINNIKQNKEQNGKTWEEAVLEEIKVKYPDIEDSFSYNDDITKLIQTTLEDIQTKYKEIDGLKSKMIDLINKLN